MNPNLHTGVVAWFYTFISQDLIASLAQLEKQPYHHFEKKALQSKWFKKPFLRFPAIKWTVITLKCSFVKCMHKI